MKGCPPLAYSHQEYPGTHTLSSGRVEFLYTLRCLNTTGLAGWEERAHHRLDNKRVVKKCRHTCRNFRATTTADAGLWKAMSAYLDEWRDEATISWVKAHAEDSGAVTNDHEKQNKKRTTTPRTLPTTLTSPCTGKDTAPGSTQSGVPRLTGH